MSSIEPEDVVESLRQERLHVQKKTFTKWANIYLAKFGLEITDLFQDMGDGLKLMKLLESLSGEKLGKPAKGTSRIKRIENVSRCLMFLHSKKMRLENISSEDIVDGKPHLILGLLWMIILRYEIPNQVPQTNAEVSENVPPPTDEKNKQVPKISKESLLLWCQTKTNGYPCVCVKDFHRSWRDGLAFNALIHSHAPSLVDFQSLKQEEHIRNLDNAFSIAQRHIGVPRLMDPEDVDTDNPDEKSILVYVSTFCKGLGKYRGEITLGRRIANVINKTKEIEKLKKSYTKEAGELMDWIHSKLRYFESQDNLESLQDIQTEIANFKTYRTVEKPPQYEKKNQIEVLYFSIQMKRFGKNGWIPPESVSPAAIERAWSELQRAEHEHEIKIRNKLKEQERLENLAYKFESKRAVREAYINEIQKILTDPNYGASLKQSDATFKKHEAIRTGIIAREIMIQDLFKISEVLIQSNYRKKDEVILWKKETEEKWNYILSLLEAYDEKFAKLREIITTIEETDSILEEMQQLQTELDTETEPLDVSASLQKHALREVQIASWAEAVHRFEKKIEKKETMKDTNILQTQIKKLKNSHQRLIQAARVRREILEEQLKKKEYEENVQEIFAWIFEKQLYCTAEVCCKDLASALLLQKNHKILGSEILLQKELVENMNDQRLKSALLELEKHYKEKEKFIVIAVEAFQYIRDADECASWISKKMHLLSTLDYGTDELTCEALLRRHAHMDEKIKAHSVEIKALREVSEKLRDSLHSIPRSFIKRQAPAGRNTLSDAEFCPQDFVRNCNLNTENTYGRQVEIENEYDKLQRKSEKRKRRLHQALMFFDFKDRCDEIEKWMREKEKIMDSNDFGSQADEVEKKFEEFLTDMVAHGLIIEELQSIVNQLEEGKAEQAKTARMLLEDIQRRWRHLNKLTRLKEQNLKGYTSIILANRMCESCITFLNETLTSEEYDAVEDIKSFEDLRRKQEAIERELNIAEERVKQAIVLSENVSVAHPDQTASLKNQVQVLHDKWEKLQIQTKERQKRIQEQANIKIFKAKAQSLMEWSQDLQRKLRIQEKISDLEVAQNVAKYHKDIGNEIEIQEYRFSEVEDLGLNLSQTYPEVEPLLHQLSEARKRVRALWELKHSWIIQNVDLQIFDREANHLHSILLNQNTLLDVAESGDTLGDIEILIRHHDSLMDTLKVQRSRFAMFNEMADKLLESNHNQKDYIRSKRDEINELREGVLEKANERGVRLQQEYQLQEFKFDTQEIITWIAEKNKRALDVIQSDDTINLSYKIKKLETLEAEISANKCRVQNSYSIGEKLFEECSFARVSLDQILNELEREWNVLCDKLELIQQSIYESRELNDFNSSVDLIERKLDEIKISADSTCCADYRSVKNMLKQQEIMENELEKLKVKVSNLVQICQHLTEESEENQKNVQNVLSGIEKKLITDEQLLVTRRGKLETCMRFYHFKSEVERELMWISDQIILLSTDTPCQNLLEAQKLHKKLENLEVTLEYHQKKVENLSKEVLVLVAEEECIVDITRTCQTMEEEWNKLLGIFYDKKTKTNFTLKAQMFYSEAAEIDTWISEKKQALSSTDYGKDEDVLIKLLTKQKEIELEIDSYKGLVGELSNQAASLIELKNPDSKIIKNRMETIEQDMTNLQNLCLTRRQKLLESKNEIEFEKETEELDAWINEKMVQATSDDYGSDYEHVLRLHTTFEFYKARIEAGSKRIIQYEAFAKRLISNKCPFTDKVHKGLEHLSSRWSELLENLEARAFKLEAAAEIHRYHRDVTDVLERIHSYYETLPNDLGSSLAQAQQLAKKHDAIENELLGIEAQLHLLVEDSRRLIETYPGGNEEHIQMQLALVIENWNSLQQKVASRKENLIAAQRIHRFITMIREEETWSKQMCFELKSNNMPRDIEQIESQHQITKIEIDARLSKYEDMRNDGESLLVFNLFHKQIEEKLQALSEIEKEVKNSWALRCALVDRTKAIMSFFNEAKQIQASLASKEVQLCGSETKETVEDLERILKKHHEFQKTMEIQDEKFEAWELQGRALLIEKVPESERISKKIEELSNRRKRLLNFSRERSDSYSNALRLAKLKQDIIEVEAWIKEKRNKLRILLKDYNLLNADEKIKCLQKQQSIQAEIEAHEPIIQRIIQERKEIASINEELNMRVELILENWEEVKGNVKKMGSDLKDAQDMLVMYDYFEKAENWIKEKDLLIQKNDVGKDYEHCVSLQMKLDDNNSGNKLDDSFMHEMRVLADKLSRKENQSATYLRFERINERWTHLNQEIFLYRKKLNDAAEVHAFVKDMDDTIDRIREKSMFLSAKQEVYNLEAAEMMRRKLETIEKDLTTIDKKLKEQFKRGQHLAGMHELSAGKIYDKMNQAEREWSELQNDLERKKKLMDAVHISLKFVKDCDDMEKIISDIIKEMEYGAEPSDSADATSLLEAHQHDQAQVKTCQEKIKSLQKYGEEVLKTPGVLVEEIGHSIQTLSLMSKNIQMTWEYRLNLLTKFRYVHIFSEKAKQIETWFASKEAFLANKDVGDSMSSVEALIRKHENFEITCIKYFEKLKELETLISDIRKYEDCDDIENWFHEICNRRDRFLETCQKRKKILNDSKTYQEMLLHLYEVSNWMNEKIQLVSDDSYKDLRNLVSKIQKHATLEAEILANHSRVVAITTQADDMLRESHFASDEIRNHIQNLEDLWQTLMDQTNEKKSKLNDAYNALKYKQKLEDINAWLDEIEGEFQFESYAADVYSIQQEIDKLRNIEKDVLEIGEKLRILHATSEEFEHHSKDDIIGSLHETEERYRSIDDSVVMKFAKLQEDLSFAGLEKDVNDELSWIEDNIAVCQSEEYFDDIISVQVLQKKLQALETEMLSREPLIDSLVDRGLRLNSQNAEICVKHLQKRFQELKDSITLRRLRLSDALECQTYYFEVAQAEIWMKEKMTQISSCDAGDDLYVVQEMKKKISAIEAATSGFKQNIKSLEEMSSNLIGRSHYDSHNIRTKQEELSNRYEELNCAILKKIALLQEEEEYFSYQRDVNAIVSQLKSLAAATNSTDLGRDVEHVESLLQKLELHRNKLCGHENTVKSLQQRANSLTDGGHIHSEKIKKLLTDLEDAWLQCDYSAESRFKALEQAKFIHSFKKSADETISWIYEKDVAFSSENYGHDVQSIETLLRHHETLERDLRAIQEQVEALREEAETLSEKLPDSKDTLEEKYTDVVNAYEMCSQKAIDRKEKLVQAEQIQAYFDEARDFQAWISEMSAMMTQVELAEDVAACEAALELHDGFKSEIDSQIQSFRQFENRGHEIIKKGHFMTPEIQERLQDLNSSFESLLNLWRDKRTNLEHFLDFQLFKKKVKKLEAWLQGQEYNLAEEDGRSLEEVNYLIRKQEQLEEKLRLYEEKFEELRKTTKIEEELQSKTKDRTKSEETKLEEQRKEEFKRKEEERLLEERRKERAQFERQIPQAEISDDDLTPRNNLTESEQIFKRYDSKRSFQDRKQHQISKIPLPPVKPNTPAPPPTTAEGFLQRKQEIFSGGKRSTSRTWKTYYTVLCGQLLCFFKDKKAFTQRNAAKAPINILGARCSLPKDYRKKKYVFRLEPTDNSSFLFEAPNDIKRDEWVQKINYTASLPPSMQLMMPADETDSIMNYRKDSTFSVSSEYRKWDDIEYDEPFEAKRNERVSFAEEPLYDDIAHNIDHVSNPIYAIPHADIDSRSSTLSSYNDNLESARSSVSDQSYRTALASSTSTLQDEHYESSDDDVMYSMPEALSRTRSDMSVDAQEHERVQKYNSVPRNVGTTKPETKKRWSVFSLRRKH